MADIPAKFHRMKVHQVHPAKLAVDVGSAVASSVLLWHGRRLSGLTVRYGGPLLGSAAVLSCADLERLAGTRRGRYVQRHMPPSMQAVRFGGDLLMTAGAASRRRGLLVAGLLIVAAGWSHGLIRPSSGR